MNVIPNPPAPQTPPLTPSASAQQPLSTRVTVAIESALPGVDAGKLISTLDSLLGGRGRYALVGSTSLHLHAIEQPNLTQTLPLPNDLDVVFDHRSSIKLETSSEQELAEMNLRRNPKLAHVLYFARENMPDLKIDLVTSTTPGFAKYYDKVNTIDGIPLGRLSDTIADYKNRLIDPEFIAECGGKEKAEQKIGPWLTYFDSAAKRQVNSPDRAKESFAKRLKFGD